MVEADIPDSEVRLLRVMVADCVVLGSEPPFEGEVWMVRPMVWGVGVVEVEVDWGVGKADRVVVRRRERRRVGVYIVGSW